VAAHFVVKKPENEKEMVQNCLVSETVEAAGKMLESAAEEGTVYSSLRGIGYLG
jgi:hypothetical protein